MKNCPGCGRELYDFAQRCDSCGARGLDSVGINNQTLPAKDILQNPVKKKEIIQQEPQSGTVSAQFIYALELLKEDAVKSFRDDYEKRILSYGSRVEVHYDAYMEVLIERTGLPNIVKMLRHWAKYLEALPNCQHKRGGQAVINALASLCSETDNMRPVEV